MRHLNKGRKLNRTSSHRKAMFSNMATSLFRHERITTTTPKAKDLRALVEGLIELGKQNSLHARRQAYQIIRDQDILKKIFNDIARRYYNRAGGYTRVVKSSFRKGDCAQLSVIELVS